MTIATIPPPTWNDTRVEALKQLWANGLSASEIAGQLGGITRNAVIGKVHRLGLTGRTRRRARAITPRPRTARPAPSGHPAFRALFTATDFTAAAPDMVIPPEERKTIHTLTASSCRWPYGDPKHADFHFCGRTRFMTLPYCENHAPRAFRPPRPRPPKRARIGNSPGRAPETELRAKAHASS